MNKQKILNKIEEVKMKVNDNTWYIEMPEVMKYIDEILEVVEKEWE